MMIKGFVESIVHLCLLVTAITDDLPGSFFRATYWAADEAWRLLRRIDRLDVHAAVEALRAAAQDLRDAWDADDDAVDACAGQDDLALIRAVQNLIDIDNLLQVAADTARWLLAQAGIPNDIVKAARAVVDAPRSLEAAWWLHEAIEAHGLEDPHDLEWQVVRARDAAEEVAGTVIDARDRLSIRNNYGAGRPHEIADGLEVLADALRLLADTDWCDVDDVLDAIAAAAHYAAWDGPADCPIEGEAGDLQDAVAIAASPVDAVCYGCERNFESTPAVVRARRGDDRVVALCAECAQAGIDYGDVVAIVEGTLDA